MKCEAKTEAEMREAKAPWPHTQAELTEYIESLTNREHDYGTCIYAMSLAAAAAYNYVAHVLGTTGFQASCAGLCFIRTTRNIKGPFRLTTVDNALYPQYNLHGEFLDFMESESARQWIADEARRLLITKCDIASPDVIDHWRKLAATMPPKTDTVGTLPAV